MDTHQILRKPTSSLISWFWDRFGLSLLLFLQALGPLSFDAPFSQEVVLETLLSRIESSPTVDVGLRPTDLIVTRILIACVNETDSFTVLVYTYRPRAFY